MKVFEQRKYQPKLFIGVSGPDQGQAFEGLVGKAAANGVMVPNSWDGAYQNSLSENMVEEYIAKYGGTAAGINADVAEAFSTGEVAADAVEHTHGTNNVRILGYLHSGVTLQTVQGPAKFDKLGREPRRRRLHFPVAGRQLQSGASAGRPEFVHAAVPEDALVWLSA